MSNTIGECVKAFDLFPGTVKNLTLTQHDKGELVQSGHSKYEGGLLGIVDYQNALLIPESSTKSELFTAGS